jgi:hypothetical protein
MRKRDGESGVVPGYHESRYNVAEARIRQAGRRIQIILIGAALTALSEKRSGPQIGRVCARFLPTHSRSWPLGRPWLLPNTRQADRIFMQRRPRGERPDLPPIGQVRLLPSGPVTGAAAASVSVGTRAAIA